MVKQCVSFGPDRPHSVYRLTDQIYKVVQFYDVRPCLGPGPRETHKHYDKKLDSSLSRTRRIILEKALCNHWEWFFTATIDAEKCDRKNLQAWHDSFSQWIRDQRKKYRKQGYHLKHMLVPERHKDGSWHAHGFLTGIPESELISFREMDKRGYRTARGRRIKKELRNSDYMNWPAYQEKYGYCSLGAIRNPVAAGFYITKYITKDNDRMVQDVGLHSHYSSRPLQCATKHVDFYGRDPEIDRLLVNKYDFCATGMTHVKDNCDFTFCMEFVDFKDLEPLEFDSCEKSVPELEADAYYEFEQMMLQM